MQMLGGMATSALGAATSGGSAGAMGNAAAGSALSSVMDMIGGGGTDASSSSQQVGGTMQGAPSTFANPASQRPQQAQQAQHQRTAAKPRRASDMFTQYVQNRLQNGIENGFQGGRGNRGGAEPVGESLMAQILRQRMGGR